MEVLQVLQKHKQVLKWRKACKATQMTLEHFWAGVQGNPTMQGFHGSDSVEEGQ